MVDQSTFSRRRLLAFAGVGLGISVAGCAGQGEQRRVTVSLQPAQEDLEPARAEARRIQRQQLSGNLTRAQAQQQLSQLQADLYDGLIDTATEEAESLGLTVEDSIEPDTMLVSGSEDAIMDLLDLDIVAGLSGPENFEQLEQQQQQPQQPQQPTDDSTTDGETETENESAA